MKKKFFRYAFGICLLALSFTAGVKTSPAADNFKWQRFSGRWIIKDSHLFEKRGWAAPWHYWEILNYNSIISFNSFSGYDSIEITMAVLKPLEKIKKRDKVPQSMFSFFVKSPSGHWNYHMYAVKFSGDSEGLNKVSLIHSDRRDKTKRYATKYNTFVNELASSILKIDYNKEYSLKIDLSGDAAVISIDGNVVLKGKIPDNEHGGKIAISSKNLLLKIDEISVFNKNELIFKDDFTRDTIYTPRMRAKKVK